MSTPKKATKATEIDFPKLLRAIKSVLADGISQAEASRRYEVDRMRLLRQCKLLKASHEDISAVSDDVLLKELESNLRRTPSNMVSYTFPRFSHSK